MQQMSPGADSEGGACVLLAANINLRGRVLADAHEGQAGLDAACLQGRYPQARLIQKLLRDGPSVYEVALRHWVPVLRGADTPVRSGFGIYTYITGRPGCAES